MRIGRWAMVFALVIGAASCDTCRRLSGDCCKVCRDGKACGDSCISSTSECHQAPGCACNGEIDRLLVPSE